VRLILDALMCPLSFFPFFVFSFLYYPFFLLLQLLFFSPPKKASSLIPRNLGSTCKLALLSEGFRPFGSYPFFPDEDVTPMVSPLPKTRFAPTSLLSSTFLRARGTGFPPLSPLVRPLNNINLFPSFLNLSLQLCVST